MGNLDWMADLTLADRKRDLERQLRDAELAHQLASSSEDGAPRALDHAAVVVRVEPTSASAVTLPDCGDTLVKPAHTAV